MNYPITWATLATDSLLVLRWVTRVFSLLSSAIILVFFIGEGFHPTQITAMEWSLLLCFPGAVMLGFVVAWRKESVGGFVAVGGLLGFYLVHAIVANGHLPRGWAYLLLASPGFLFLLLAWLTRRLTAPETPSPTS